jgi:hypothetical protein
MLALHDRRAVHSLRHAPSWLMLTMAVGRARALAIAKKPASRAES